MPDYVPMFGIDNVRREIEKLRRLWDGRKHSDAIDWEDSLAALATGRHTDSSLRQELACDPGITVLRDLINAARAGADVEQLKLATRLLRLTHGLLALQSQLDAHWALRPPEMFGATEAASFGELRIDWGKGSGSSICKKAIRYRVSFCGSEVNSPPLRRRRPK